MNSDIRQACDLTINNFRKVREEFRFDAEYINHFAAVLYSNAKKEIPSEKIKKIRIYIKENTSRMSCFRGDILYILSFLIGMEEKSKIFTDLVLEINRELIENGFKESQYLVLTSYALVKHLKLVDNRVYISKIKEIFVELKKHYKDITNEEDYLEFALLAINGIDKDIIYNYMDNIFNTLGYLENFSKNSIQGLTLGVILNKNTSSLIRIEQLLLEFQEKKIPISHQFMPLIAVSAGSYIVEEYSKEIIEIINYLCNEEYEYEYYMDRSFRVFLAISILEYCNNKGTEKYLNELIAMGVYSFIVSKNQGILSEVLA